MIFLKMWLVAKHEYIYNFKRRSFLFTAFVLPILMGVGFYLVGRLAADSETNLDDFSRIGYVDHAGILSDTDDFDDDFKRFMPFASEEDAKTAYDADDIDGYFIISTDYLDLGQIQFLADKGLPEALRDDFGDFLISAMVRDLPDTLNINRLKNVSNVQIQLVGEDEPSDEEALIGRFILPLIFALVMLMSVLTTSQFLMSSVVEEKENRIMEILMISIRPVQLIIGKFLGLGALALTQVAFWALTAVFIANATGQLDVLADVRLKPLEIVVMALYFLLTFGLYAGIMIAIGSAVSAEQESRQVAAIFTLIFVSPSWAIGAFFEAPTGPVTTAFGLFPMTSGLSNLVLIGLGETRAWQIMLSLGLLFAATLLTLLAAAKIFRAGALMYGQRLSLRQLRRALVG